jgi:AcrR family transcriptional regulator
MGPRRARQIHEKEARRQDILAAAGRVWDAIAFPSISMAEVASQAGLAKGTLYIYFRTKEELFLAMAEEELLEWYEELDDSLRRGPKAPGPGEIAALVAGSLGAHPRLPRLLAILHTALEHNIEHLTALRFNQFLATRVVRTGRLLERRFPPLQEGQGAALVLRIHALVIGLGQLADRAPVVRKILDAPALPLFRVDFLAELEGTLKDLLSGINLRPGT